VFFSLDDQRRTPYNKQYRRLLAAYASGRERCRAIGLLSKAFGPTTMTRWHTSTY